MSLEKEFRYFLDNQAELVAKYNGKFLVIKKEKIIGVYDTKQQAYDTATAQNELGTFLIQQCLPGNIGTTQTFHSQAIFTNLITAR
jgi:hypothetical protein